MQMCFCRYVCFFYLCGNHRDLHLLTHSVPTRRASDRKTENARPATWVYVDVRWRDLASVVGDLQRAVAKQVRLSPGVSLAYSGQFEYLERAVDRLKLVVPATLLIIFVLLYLILDRKSVV